MAGAGEPAAAKEDIKSQFVTREGTYRLLALSEYSRPNRVAYGGGAGGGAPAGVRVSLVTLPQAPSQPDPADEAPPPQPPPEDRDRIAFNYGKELYVYVYRGVRKVPSAVSAPRPLAISPSHLRALSLPGRRSVQTGRQKNLQGNQSDLSRLQRGHDDPV